MSEIGSPETIVIGGGIIGAAITRKLVRDGVRVCLIEADQPGHRTASSKGDARIRVLAAYPDDEYLALGIRADQLWRGLEMESGRRLLHHTGAVSYGDLDGGLVSALERHDVDYLQLSVAEAAARLPVLQLPPDTESIVYQPDGAIIPADTALAATLESARRHGAELITAEPVTELEDEGAQVRVTTGRRSLRAGRVVVAAGSWTANLLNWPELQQRLTPTAQTISYFAWEGDPPPAVIDYHGAEPYCGWSPAYGIKAADHELGPVIEPGDLPSPDPDRVARTGEWLAKRFGISPTPLYSETCVYTNTPDERFLIKDRGLITAVSACNGQGFQFSPAVAETVARHLAG